MSFLLVLFPNRPLISSFIINSTTYKENWSIVLQHRKYVIYTYMEFVIVTKGLYYHWTIIVLQCLYHLGDGNLLSTQYHHQLLPSTPKPKDWWGHLLTSITERYCPLWKAIVLTNPYPFLGKLLASHPHFLFLSPGSNTLSCPCPSLNVILEFSVEGLRPHGLCYTFLS